MAWQIFWLNTLRYFSSSLRSTDTRFDILGLIFVIKLQFKFILRFAFDSNHPFIADRPSHYALCVLQSSSNAMLSHIIRLFVHQHWPLIAAFASFSLLRFDLAPISQKQNTLWGFAYEFNKFDTLFSFRSQSKLKERHCDGDVTFCVWCFFVRDFFCWNECVLRRARLKWKRFVNILANLNLSICFSFNKHFLYQFWCIMGKMKFILDILTRGNSAIVHSSLGYNQHTQTVKRLEVGNLRNYPPWDS